MAWDTAATVINDALTELALTDSDVAEPYTSTDATVIHMRRLLKVAGRDLLRLHPWSHLRATHTFSTVVGTTQYDLPADFARLVDGTQWNRTEQEPLGGPNTSQQWQLLKAIDTVGTRDYYHRITANKFEVHPTPTVVDALAYEYQSLHWVQPDGETAPTSETPSAGTDTLWFDGHLLTRRLKVLWLEAKGFDSSAARAEYEATLAQAMGADGAAPVLRLDGQPMGLWRMLDEENAPETGYGD